VLLSDNLIVLFYDSLHEYKIVSTAVSDRSVHLYFLCSSSFLVQHNRSTESGLFIQRLLQPYLRGADNLQMCLFFVVSRYYFNFVFSDTYL
jgi:hypothetical protein